jgi:hypothetical protein
MRATLTSSSLASLVVVVAALIFAAAASRTPPIWGSDSFVYAVRAQLIAGVPQREAVASTRAFLRTLPNAQDNASNSLPLNEQPGWRLFTVRRVYSLLAAALWGRRGFAALPEISILSYACAIVAMFWLASSVVTKEIACAAAIAFGALSFRWANAALTDMTAELFLVVALGALCRYLSTPRLPLLVVYAISTGLLTFTRPIPYLLFFAAAAPLSSALLRRDAAGTRAGVRLVVVALAWCVSLAIAAAALRVPSFWSQLAHLHDYWTGTIVRSVRALTLWWAGTTFAIARDWLLYDAPFVWPLLGVAGLLVRMRDARFCALFGMWCAGFVSIALNPDPYAMPRTVMLPALPALLCGVAGLIAIPLARRRAGHGARLTARPTIFL